MKKRMGHVLESGLADAVSVYISIGFQSKSMQVHDAGSLLILDMVLMAGVQGKRVWRCAMLCWMSVWTHGGAARSFENLK